MFLLAVSPLIKKKATALTTISSLAIPFGHP